MSFNNRIPFEGVLNCWNDEHDLPDLLLTICRAKRTGKLSFSNPEGDKTVHVQDGKIVFAQSSSGDDGLGHFLLRTGKISLVDYLRISKLVEPGRRLGALLVAEGVLEAKDLFPAVMGQVRAIILGLFRRTETWYRFKQEPLEKESITLDIPIEKLVLDGIRQVDSWRRVSKGVGNLESIYARVDAKKEEWSRFGLADEALELIAMLSKAVSVAHICTHAKLPDFEACRYVWAFRCLGWVTPADSRTERAAQLGAETKPPLARPSVASTVIPQQLITTRVSMDEPTRMTPDAIPEDLAMTRLSVEPPSSIEEPGTIVPEAERTQLFIEPAMPPPSTAEMMEAILSEESSRAPEPSRLQSPRGSKTNVSATPRALTSVDEPPAGFEALAFDGPAEHSTVPSLPRQPEENRANGGGVAFEDHEETSFRDLAYDSDDPYAAMGQGFRSPETPPPIVEASLPPEPNRKARPPQPRPDETQVDFDTGGLAHLLSLDD